MQVTITQAPITEKPLLRRLLELNAHHFSQYDGAELGEQGEYGYEYLDLYWTESERHPLVIRVDDKIAGFALVRAGDPHQLAEFFVLNKYRRRGVGRAAAATIFQRFPAGGRCTRCPATMRP